MLFRRIENLLSPVDDEAHDYVTAMSKSDVVSAEFRKARNTQFHRKFFALLKFAFDVWSERCGQREYKGKTVEPNFERFRADVTILAGYYEPIFDVRGDTRLQAKSIAFSRMDEAEFADLYSRVIDVLLNKVFPDLEMTEADLTQAVDNVLSYT